jgi:2-dehydropantoate 2-reductase
MMITIAGCGALGSLLAARLIEGGAHVQAYQRRGPQLEALQRQGITIVKDRMGEDRSFNLRGAAAASEDLQPSPLIIVLVKAFSTTEIEPVGALLEEGGAVLTLQNGLGNAEKLAELFGADRIAAGIDTYGAYQIAPGLTGWGGDGQIQLGPWLAGQDMAWIAALLKNHGLNAAYVDDPRPALWRKLAINAMVNPTSALTRMPNAHLLKSRRIRAMMQKLGKETIQAAQRAGVKLDFEQVWQLLTETLERTAGNKTSMLQDISAAKPTEIEAISGSLLQYARHADDFPYTRAVYALIKAIDENRLITP